MLPAPGSAVGPFVNVIDDTGVMPGTLPPQLQRVESGPDLEADRTIVVSSLTCRRTPSGDSVESHAKGSMVTGYSQYLIRSATSGASATQSMRLDCDVAGSPPRGPGGAISRLESGQAAGAVTSLGLKRQLCRFRSDS